MENGKIALAHGLLHGFGFGSTEFHVLRAREEMLEAQYLFYFLRQKNFRCQASQAMTGAVGQQRVPKDFIEQFQIPLPPPSEQRKIVEILDQADRLRKLRAEADKKAERILIAGFYKNFGNPAAIDTSANNLPLGKLIEINPKKSEIENLMKSDEISFVPMSAVDEKAGRIVDFMKRPYSEVKTGFTYFYEGDVLFAKITPCMENGKAAIARDLINHIGFGSTEFHVLRPKKDVNAEWIFGLIRLPIFRKFAQQRFAGAVGQQRVPEDFIKSFRVIKPEKDSLKAFTLLFNEIMVYTNKGREAANIIEVLFSTLLHRAFTGDLTASWRQAHMKELLKEMEIQARILAG